MARRAAALYLSTGSEAVWILRLVLWIPGSGSDAQGAMPKRAACCQTQHESGRLKDALLTARHASSSPISIYSSGCMFTTLEDKCQPQALCRVQCRGRAVGQCRTVGVGLAESSDIWYCNGTLPWTDVQILPVEPDIVDFKPTIRVLCKKFITVFTSCSQWCRRNLPKLQTKAVLCLQAALDM